MSNAPAWHVAASLRAVAAVLAQRPDMPDDALLPLWAAYEADGRAAAADDLPDWEREFIERQAVEEETGG